MLRWRGDTPLTDRAGVAALYQVSERTVRRHCTPVGRGPQQRALYDVLACEHELAEVMPRPERTVEAQARRRQFVQRTVEQRQRRLARDTGR